MTPSPATLPPLRGLPLILATICLSLAMFMQMLDTTIANVSIPHIAGDLAVSPNQGTWVITSFAVSAAIALPLTGWLAQRFGEIRMFVGATLMFSLTSWACGLAPNFELLVATRALQGLAAGPMVPLSQTILLSCYPREKKGHALSFWAMTTMVAPIAGPLLGGWITDNYSWPWIFYINVPVGLFASFAIWQLLRERETATRKVPVDVIGLSLLVIGIGSLQILLDKGNELDWFNSAFIITLGVVVVIALSFFVVWELTDPHPIVDLSLFRRRNFTVGALALGIGYATLFSGAVVVPLWLQTQMGYTATWAGLAVAPFGVMAIFLSPIVGRNLSKLNLQRLVSFALVVFALTSVWQSTFNTDADFAYIAWPRFVQGIGVACFPVPLMTILLSGLQPRQVATATGLANFLRMLGGSFGTSLSITLWERRASWHQSRLTDNITDFNLVSYITLDRLQSIGLAPQQAMQFTSQTISQQAVMLATDDVFLMFAGIFLSLLALVWLAKPPFGDKGAVGGKR
ncbi:MAG: DHA2 family efflux MFS transporter permease subunit [Pseudomonadota bacterium]